MTTETTSDSRRKVVPQMVETDEATPKRRYRRGDGLAAQQRIVARVAEPIADALTRRASSTGRTKNEIVETALARALGVEEACR